MRFLLFALLLLVGCSEELDRPIRIVVEPGFRGPIGILAHSAYPDRIVRGPDAFVITVPSDGIVRTNNVEVFGKWHGTETLDTTGHQVNDLSSGDSMIGSGIPGEIIWFYRGPKEEFDLFMYGPDNMDLKYAWLQERGIVDDHP